MSDSDSPSADPVDPDVTATDEPIPTDDPTDASSDADGAEPPDGDGLGDEEEPPWFKNPIIIAAILIALLAVLFLAWNTGNDDESEEDIELSMDELVALCLAQEGTDSDDACADLALILSDDEKAEFARQCTEGDADACRLLELIGEPVPTATTTTSSTSSTTAPPTAPSGGDTIIVLPPPAPGEPTPPPPTIPELPDPTLDELIEACLAEDGATSDLACEYLEDNLTESQKDVIRQTCLGGNDDACRLLELIGEDVPETTTTTTAAVGGDDEAES